MLTRTRTLLTLMLVTVMLFASAEARKGRSKGMGPGKGDGLKELVNLTDDQVRDIEKLRLGTQKDVMDYHYQIKKERLSLREQALNGKLSKSDLKASLKKVSALQDKIHAARLATSLNVIDVLNDDQVKKLAEKRGFGRLFGGFHGPDSMGKMRDCRKKGSACPKGRK